MDYENKQPQRIGELLKLSGRVNSRTSRLPIESKESTNSERASLIGTITDRLNAERDGKKYKKLSYAAIGFKLAHIPTKDLYYLIKICEDAKNFSSHFWWSINPKNHL